MLSKDEVKRVGLTAKIVHLAFLVSSFIYVYLLWYMNHTGVLPAILDGDPILNTVILVLAVMALLSLAAVWFMPGFLLRHSLQERSQSLLFAVIIRGAFLESVAIYGLILGVLGADSLVLLPFFLATIAGLILTFPTEERLNGMLK